MNLFIADKTLIHRLTLSLTAAAALSVVTGCDQANDKNANYVEPTRTDSFAPNLFIEQPTIDHVGKDKVTVSFSSNENAKVVISIRPQGAPLSAEQLFTLAESGNIDTSKIDKKVATWAKVKKTLSFDQLNPDTSYDIYFIAEDNNGNRQPSPTILPIKTLAVDVKVAFSNKPKEGFQGLVWSFSPLTAPAIQVVRLKEGPAWLSWDRITQTLTGVPDDEAYRARKFTFTMETDQAGYTGEQTFDVVVHGDPLAEYAWHLNNTGQSAFAWDSGLPGYDINLAPVLHEGWTGGKSKKSPEPVRVLVADSGLQKDHPDLKNNFDEDNSRNFINGSNDPSPDLTTRKGGDHGTSVAGIIAAEAWNDIGSRGIAPEAKIAGANVLSAQNLPPEQPKGDNPDEWKAYLDAVKASREEGEKNFKRILNPDEFNVDIINQSFGIPAENFRGDFAPGAMDSDYRTMLKQAVTSGRRGLGTIIIKSAGNSGGKNQDANFDPTNVSPYQMIIGAINALGKKSSYSSPGANLWVSAPGGEGGFQSEYSAMDDDHRGFYARSLFTPAVITTDVDVIDEENTPLKPKCKAGYAQSLEAFDAGGGMSKKDAEQLFATGGGSGFNVGRSQFNSDCYYTATFNGTSSAAPMVSGVVALLLQKNPDLSWRDIKHILASTARKIDADNAGRLAIVAPDTDDEGKVDPDKPFNTFTTLNPWQTNSAGFHFHNWYGFGLIDAAAALKMADPKTYKKLPPPLEEPIEETADITAMKIDINAPFPDKTPSFNINPDIYENVIIEAVELQVEITTEGYGSASEDAKKRSDMSRIGIELISPSGTRSILIPVQNGGNFYGYFSTDSTAKVIGKEFISNAFYGEKASGTWTLRITDGKSGKKRYKEQKPGSNPPEMEDKIEKLKPATMANAKLTLYGHEYAK